MTTPEKLMSWTKDQEQVYRIACYFNIDLRNESTILSRRLAKLHKKNLIRVGYRVMTGPGVAYIHDERYEDDIEHLKDLPHIQLPLTTLEKKLSGVSYP